VRTFFLLAILIEVVLPIPLRAQMCDVVPPGSSLSGRCLHTNHVCSPTTDGSAAGKGKCINSGGAGEHECTCASVSPVHPPPAPASRVFSYSGGDVLLSASIVAVYWGAQPPGLVAALNAYYARITTDDYFSALAEYNAGPPTFVGGFAIDLTDTRAFLDTTTIANEIEKQIVLQVLPAPSPNTVYAVHFGTANVPMLGGNLPLAPGLPLPTQPLVVGVPPGSGFCAYHFTARTELPILPPFYFLKGPKLRIAVIPEDSVIPACAISGFPNTPINQATFNSSHEISEAITDPDSVVLAMQPLQILQCGPVIFPPGAALDAGDANLSWTSNFSQICSPDEIADPCSAPVMYPGTPGVTSDLVTQLFSKSKKACALGSTAPPVDNSPSGKRRACLLDCATNRRECTVKPTMSDGSNDCDTAYKTCTAGC
jgi:hypothetical protein